MESLLHELETDLLRFDEELKIWVETLKRLTYKSRCIETAMFYGMKKKPDFCIDCELCHPINEDPTRDILFVCPVEFVCKIADRSMTMQEAIAFPTWCPLGWGQLSVNHAREELSQCLINTGI